MTVTIKFSHVYAKAPHSLGDTWLIGVSLCQVEALPEQFLSWDTLYYGTPEENFKLGHYPLPRAGTFMVLTLFSVMPNRNMDQEAPAQVWTTVRSWDAAKESYYRALIGQRVKIEVENTHYRELTNEDYKKAVALYESRAEWLKCPSCGHSAWRVNYCSECGRKLTAQAETKQATL